MKLVFCLLVLTCQLAFVYAPKAHIEILLQPTYTGSLDVYESANCKVFKHVSNNILREDYVYMEVLSSSDSFYQVRVGYLIDNSRFMGWVKKNNPAFVVYAKAKNKTVYLYNKPELTAGKISLQHYNSEELKVLDLIEDWVKVTLKRGPEQFTGWMPAEFICIDPYNLCSGS